MQCNSSYHLLFILGLPNIAQTQNFFLYFHRFPPFFALPMRSALVLLFLFLIYCDFCFFYHANTFGYQYSQIDKIPNAKSFSFIAYRSYTKYEYDLVDTCLYQIALLGCLVVYFFSVSLSHFSENFRFIPFHQSLDSLKPSINSIDRPPTKESVISLAYVILLISLVFENQDLIVFLCMFSNLNILFFWKFLIQLYPYLHRLCQFTQLMIFFP